MEDELSLYLEEIEALAVPTHFKVDSQVDLLETDLDEFETEEEWFDGS